MDNTPIYLSRKDAADRLAVSIRTIDRLCTAQKLIKVAILGRRLIDATSLDQFANTVAPEGATPTAQDLFPIRELEPEIDQQDETDEPEARAA